MVEAGGIEPPSRDVSVDASTRVVRSLFSPGQAPADGILPDYPELRGSQPSRQEKVGRYPALWRPSDPRRLRSVDVTAYAARANSVLAVVLCEVFFEASSQPRRAASTSSRPVESIRPHRRTGRTPSRFLPYVYAGSPRLSSEISLEEHPLTRGGRPGSIRTSLGASLSTWRLPTAG